MSLASLGLSCPDGGQFYVCQGNATQFLGCCAIDPCANGQGSCPETSLRNTSYNSDAYGDMAAQACVTASSSSSSSSSASASASALWYTCADTTPPFLGCCAGENPCSSGGCGGRNGTLVAARLSDNTTDASTFMTATAEAMAGSKMAMLSTGATVGIAVGSAVGALALGVILFLVYKRRERKKQTSQQQKGSGGPHGTPTTMYTLGSPNQDSTGFPSPPFPYNGGYTYGTDDKIASLPGTPGQAPTSSPPPPPPPLHQRATSMAPSYWSVASTTATDRPLQNYSPSLPSTESLGGLYVSQAQQRDPRRAQQYLKTVSEMDNSEVLRPVSELPGSESHIPRVEEERAYDRGYGAARGRRG